jgi:hypothetical protein
VIRCRSNAVLIAYKAAAWAHRVASCAVDCCGSVCYHTAILKKLWAENYWLSPVCSREADFETDCSAANVLPVGKYLSGEAQAATANQCTDVGGSMAGDLALLDTGATQQFVLDQSTVRAATSVRDSKVVDCNQFVRQDKTHSRISQSQSAVCLLV